MHKKLISLFMFAVILAGCAPAAASTRGSAPAAAQGNAPAVTQSNASTAAGNNNGTIASAAGSASNLTYPIVDTEQGKCYNDRVEIACPQAGEPFYGQDGQYTGVTPAYRDNGDGTVTDLVTGLMWQQDPASKMTYSQAVAGAASFDLAGYTDWRLPTIQELYSLILFDGTDASFCQPGQTCMVVPFIDTRYFHFSYGDTSLGDRVIDAQFATSTKYVSTTMHAAATMFGVNFADGRIKGYPVDANPNGQVKTFFVLYVRGSMQYGMNDFVDNRDGTITDRATGLTWMQSDSGTGMDWESALVYCQSQDTAGYTDWVLPDVKQLHSLVDYTRSPDTTNSAAIDPLFQSSAITNEAGQTDYPFYWSSTTHADSSGRAAFADYVSFGRAMGYMSGWIDVHGAGAQRSDPKSGDTSSYPHGHGPQGDAVRVDNYVRCMRGGNVTVTPDGGPDANRPGMSIISTGNDVQGNAPRGNSQSGPGQLPPAEAVTACSGSTDGAACSFNPPNGLLNGTCRTVQQQLACVP